MDSCRKDEVLSQTAGEIQSKSTLGQLKGGGRDLSALVNLVHDLVDDARGNAIGLLDVLRLLERLHREVTEEAFQEALPSNRQELYKLLRVMEEEGGWPHIPRFKLQTFFTHLEPDPELNPEAKGELGDDPLP
jgi:hypothetical protein